MTDQQKKYLEETIQRIVLGYRISVEEMHFLWKMSNIYSKEYKDLISRINKEYADKAQGMIDSAINDTKLNYFGEGANKEYE